MAIITIATDFGTADGYTGAVKGVIKSLAPNCEIVDITNELTTIPKAAIALYRYSACFPDGTVHLIIIDPTVGAGRRALAGSDSRYYYVGPDNGVFSMLTWNRRSVDWYNIQEDRLPPREISATFHGRDIFGPAAAMISIGHRPEEFGDKTNDPVMIEIPKARKSGDLIAGEIIDIDSFGNLITNIQGGMLSGNYKVMLEGEKVPLGRTFAHVPLGSPITYIGSLGFLEIGVNKGRADIYFKAIIGSKVRVES
jgi:S-adenosylmethionine hydrolase